MEAFANPDEFDLSKELDKNLKLFEKSHKTRTSQENTLLIKLLSHFNIFKAMDITPQRLEAELSRLLGLSEYKIFQRNTAIHHEGSTDDYIYFILHGAVNIYIPKSDKELEQEEIERKEREYKSQKEHQMLERMQAKNLLKNHSNSNESSKDPNIITSKKNPLISKPSFKSVSVSPFDFQRKNINTQRRPTAFNMKVNSDPNGPRKRWKPTIKENNPYENFHEIVLSHFEDKRYKYFRDWQCLFRLLRQMGPGESVGHTKVSLEETSAICVEETHVFFCKKENFHYLFDDVLDQKEAKEKLFFHSLEEINRPYELNLFIESFEKICFKPNEIIFAEGDEVEGLYMVCKGEVKILRKCITRDEGTRLGYSKDVLNTLPKVLPEQRSSCQISGITAGQYFGEEPLLNRKYRKYSAIAVGSQTEAYFMSNYLLHSLMNPCINLLRHLVKITKKKEMYREQRFLSLFEKVEVVEKTGFPIMEGSFGKIRKFLYEPPNREKVDPKDIDYYGLFRKDDEPRKPKPNLTQQYNNFGLPESLLQNTGSLLFNRMKSGLHFDHSRSSSRSSVNISPFRLNQLKIKRLKESKERKYEEGVREKSDIMTARELSLIHDEVSREMNEAIKGAHFLGKTAQKSLNNIRSRGDTSTRITRMAEENDHESIHIRRLSVDLPRTNFKGVQPRKESSEIFSTFLKHDQEISIIRPAEPLETIEGYNPNLTDHDEVMPIESKNTLDSYAKVLPSKFLDTTSEKQTSMKSRLGSNRKGSHDSLPVSSFRAIADRSQSKEREISPRHETLMTEEEGIFKERVSLPSIDHKYKLSLDLNLGAREIDTKKKRSASVIKSKHNMFRLKPKTNELMERYQTISAGKSSLNNMPGQIALNYTKQGKSEGSKTSRY